MHARMEDIRKEEAYSVHAAQVNPFTNIQLGGNPRPLYFPEFIWLPPSKDRVARANMLKRCAIASIVGHLESSPEAVEAVLREVCDPQHPWKVVSVEKRTCLIEFPSISSLEKASADKVLYGSKNFLVVKKWEENMGAIGSLQRIWIRLRGLPRECWIWDDVKGVVDRFCGLEKVECSESHDYVRALVVCSGPEYLPIVVRVGINCKLHDVHIYAEGGQDMSSSQLQPHYPNNTPNISNASTEHNGGTIVSSENIWKEVRVKKGYIVNMQTKDPERQNQTPPLTSPCSPKDLEGHNMKIGPSRLSREGCSKDVIESTWGITGWLKKKQEEGWLKRKQEEGQEYKGTAQGNTTGQAKRRPLELFPDDWWTNTDAEGSNSKEGDVKK